MGCSAALRPQRPLGTKSLALAMGNAGLVRTRRSFTKCTGPHLLAKMDWEGMEHMTSILSIVSTIEHGYTEAANRPPFPNCLSPLFQNES